MRAVKTAKTAAKAGARVAARVVARIGAILLAGALATSAIPAPTVGGTEYAIDGMSRNVINLQRWKTLPGDEAAWADPAYPDGDWGRVEKTGTLWLEDGFAVKGIRWYRLHLRITAEPDSMDPLYLHSFANPNAQEVYWDGEMLARNGRVGADAAQERSGRLFISVRIPPRLTHAGEHVIAVRVSNQIQITGGLGEFQLGNLKPLQNAFHGPLVLMVFLVGIFFIAGIHFFTNYLTRIQRTYALFSLFCLGCTLETLPLVAAAYNNVVMDVFMWAVAVQIMGWSLMMTALPLFFLSEFSSLGRKWYWAVGLVVALITVPQILALFINMNSFVFKTVTRANDVLGFAAIGVCLGVTGWAAFRKKEGSVLACLGLLCLLFGVAWGEIFRSTFAWALGLTALVLFLNASLVQRLTRQNMTYRENHLKGARLEIELLKKNIQPHFLLTSLRSITDWLEKEPKMAAKLVNALATELRMMLKLSAERSIALPEEIKLCRTHLEVMGLRRHRAMEMDTRGVGGEELIPPMVIHTLLEMGLEEAQAGSGDIRFLLELRRGDGLFLRLSHAAPLKPGGQHSADDTGLKYVRARLEEAFPKRWSLRAGAAEDPASEATWLAEILITDAAALAGAHSALPLRARGPALE